jgi:ABC-2 type transport system ATP-binding protein
MNLGQKKIIRLVLSKPVAEFELNGIKVIEKNSDYEYTLEVSLENNSINSVIKQLSEMCEFSDISIKELPMEKIITEIYENGLKEA